MQGSHLGVPGLEGGAWRPSSHSHVARMRGQGGGAGGGDALTLDSFSVHIYHSWNRRTYLAEVWHHTAPNDGRVCSSTRKNTRAPVSAEYSMF